MRVNGTDIIAVNGFDSGFFLVIRCAVNEQAAVFVQQLFLHVHRHNLRQEHIMAAQRQDLRHPAFQRKRAFGDQRG